VRRISHWKRWLAIAVAVAAVLFVGIPFVYIHFIEGKAPAPLSLDSPSPFASASTGSQANASDDGTWKITSGSVVGYRVQEILFGQSNTAVGRTSSVTGSMSVQGARVTTASFTADMTTVTSDQSRRDEQFNGRIMETSVYPTATFRLTEPINLGAIPAQGVERTYRATGELTLHGVTRSVTFTVTGRVTGSEIQVVGQIPITFSDYDISNPSFGPVSTQTTGSWSSSSTWCTHRHA
jgi:polyisoprenoid-binding protein YceI